MEKEKRPARLNATGSDYSTKKMAPLPKVDWGSIKAEKPVAVSSKDWDPNTYTDGVDMIIMTWTSAEWAAFAHVFWASEEEMPYEYYENESWRDGWQYYSNNWDKIKGELPDGKKHSAPSLTHQAWGSCCIVKFPSNGKTALLFKSDMHISTDGPDLPLRNMIEQLAKDFSPKLMLTIGTSGGARVQDCLGSANITNAARFDLSGEFDAKNYPFNHKTFTSDWAPKTSILDKVIASNLLMETPVKDKELEALIAKNAWELKNPATGKLYTLDELKNKEIEPGAIPPKLNVLTGTPVLTTNGYQVGNTSGNYDDFAAMEMDDAVIIMECNAHDTLAGVVRNISDPVQNADINETVQGNWGGIVYGEYGFYSSFNGALAAWAVAAAE
jgi:nucleoside phosphorylase